MGGRPFVTTRALQQLHSTNSALFVSLPFAFVAWFLDGLIEQCLVTGTGWDGCIAWFLRQPGFRSFLCLMLLPVGGFPSGWVAYSQGVCYLGCSWSSVGTARFAFLTFSTDQARDGQRYGAFWSSYGMVCVCVRVRLFRPVIFNDHEVTNFLDENIFPIILLWLFSIPAS